MLRFDLEDVGLVDEAHEGQEAAVRPAVNGDSSQVHKLVLVGDVMQTLHLVLDLHLALEGGGQRAPFRKIMNFADLSLSSSGLSKDVQTILSFTAPSKLSPR